MSESLRELIKFVQIGTRLDLKAISVEHILGLTGNENGTDEIIKVPELLLSLISLMYDTSKPIAKDSSLCLVNISAVDEGATKLINLDVKQHCPPLQKPPNNIIHEILNNVFDPNSHIADQCCMIFSNLSRHSHLIEKIVDLIDESGKTLDELINIITKTNYNKNGAKLHYLGPALSNLSQSHRVRMFILDKTKCIIQRLLAFTEYKNSLIRRGGVVGTIKNCCFEEDFHEWLLSDEVDILSHLLLPLAGNEEFDDEDNEKLPLDLQYLPNDKLREEDPDIRFILIEAITQLVAKRPNREFIRNKNTYIILRELHKWEKDRKVLDACENLINILIRCLSDEIAKSKQKRCGSITEYELVLQKNNYCTRTEDEIGTENLKNIVIPPQVQQKLIEYNNNNS